MWRSRGLYIINEEKPNRCEGRGPRSAKLRGVMEARELLCAALQAAFEGEEGGEDGFDCDESAGSGLSMFVDCAHEEIEACAGSGGQGLWTLAPDTCEMLRDAGASTAVLAALEAEAAPALARYLASAAAARAAQPSFLVAGGRCRAVLGADGEWHEATVVRVHTPPSALVRVRFSEYGNEADVDGAADVCASALGGDDDDGKERCELCERVMPISHHHLIPKTTHGRMKKKGTPRADLLRTLPLCRPCHSAVHRAESEDSLALEWNSLERLREHPKISRFVAWASGQKPVDDVVAQKWHSLGLLYRK